MSIRTPCLLAALASCLWLSAAQAGGGPERMQFTETGKTVFKEDYTLTASIERKPNGEYRVRHVVQHATGSAQEVRIGSGRFVDATSFSAVVTCTGVAGELSGEELLWSVDFSGPERAVGTVTTYYYQHNDLSKPPTFSSGGLVRAGYEVKKSAAGGKEPPATSLEGAPTGLRGLVKLDRGTYLAVINRGAAKPGTPRLLVVNFPLGGVPSYQGLDVDWLAAGLGSPPDSLQAVAWIPGREGDFLLADAGRLLHVHLEIKKGAWQVAVLGEVALPDDGTTVEGMALTLLEGGTLSVAFAQRAAGSATTNQLGRAELDLAEHSVTHKAPSLFTNLPASGPGWRGISEIAFDPQGTLWATCTYAGGEHGPFSSRLFRAEELRDPQAGAMGLRAVRYKETQTRGLDGIRLEGLAVSGSEIVIAFDDGALGAGVRRLYLPPRKARARK